MMQPPMPVSGSSCPACNKSKNGFSDGEKGFVNVRAERNREKVWNKKVYANFKKRKESIFTIPNDI